MKKFILFFSIVLYPSLNFASSDIVQKFTNPNNCQGCHREHVMDWKTSLHSQSHETKNELYKVVLDYVANKMHIPKTEVVLRCGTCHNPRLEVKESSKDYMFAKAFGIETQTTEQVDSALNANHIQNGISCYICHNINLIKPKANMETDIGYNVIEWVKDDIIAGPFPPSKRANFHKTAQRSHFIKGNNLCLICHQGQGNQNKFSLYNTGDELAQSKAKDRCVECHMPAIKEAIIAPHIKSLEEEAKPREMRSHLFAGARNSDILKNSVKISTKRVGSKIEITFENVTPHSVPSGFAARSVVANLTFFDGLKEIHNQSYEFRSKFVDKSGNETLAYTADNLDSDTRLKPLEKKVVEVYIPDGSKTLSIELDYYIIAPQIQNFIKVKDPKFNKKYPMASKKVVIH